jgi:hypothetical protein
MKRLSTAGDDRRLDEGPLWVTKDEPHGERGSVRKAAKGPPWCNAVKVVEAVKAVLLAGGTPLI